MICAFQQYCCVLSLMRIGIKMNPLQHYFLASIMIKSSLMQCGLELRHLQGLPWTGTSENLAQIEPWALSQQLGGVLSWMWLGIRVNPMHRSFLASIMIEPSLE